MYSLSEITNKILQGDSLTELRKFPDECVDTVICSPPYWALRDYKTEGIVWDAVDGCEHEWKTEITKHVGNRSGTDGGTVRMKEGIADSGIHKSDFCSKCNAWKGSLGLEPTFDLYIKHLVEIFAQVKRVLKKTGSCWVNLGDTYSQGETVSNRYGLSGSTLASAIKHNAKHKADHFSRKVIQPIPQKSLCLIPQRFQIAMVDQGWICRNTIIWYKPNCMPSSAKDRFTVDYEVIFFFVKDKKYYFETQYEPLKDPEDDIRRINAQRQGKYNSKFSDATFNRRWDNPGNCKKEWWPAFGGKKAAGYENPTYSGEQREISPLGRIKRCVWKIPTQPFSEAHFAVFPPAIVLTPLLATCPEYVCKKCGKAREKIYEKKGEFTTQWADRTNWPDFTKNDKVMYQPILQENGLKDCGCNTGFDGGLVLDPFLGSGTVALVAMQNARNFIGIELNEEYIKMAQKRLEPYLKQSRLVA